ncbi:hypothetical protein ES703_67469 [subsurface metagenome]
MSSFINEIASFINPRGAPLEPVPRIASTIKSSEISSLLKSLTCLANRSSFTEMPILRIISRLAAASPLILLFSVRRKTLTLAFRLNRCLATTIPSPPLLPGPQKTEMDLPPTGKYSFSITWVTPNPAFSISTMLGIFNFLMASASMPRISSALTIFTIFLPELLPELQHRFLYGKG